MHGLGASPRAGGRRAKSRRHGATRRCQPGRARGRATAGAGRAALYFVTRSPDRGPTTLL
eukprot:3300105-Prymnesium_polylepis.1